MKWRQVLIAVLVLLVLGVSGHLLLLPKNPPLAKEYDFIVVGGGSAGAVVASRLSEITGWTVLLLEAGGDEGLLSQVPMYVGKTVTTGWDWGYRAEETPNACQGFRDKRCPWPRGKVLGGSSVINYMVYTRGNRRDYDGWEAAGNPGWGYNHVLPYFLKSEDQKNPFYALTPYHAVGGPLTVSDANYRTPLSVAFLDAVHGLGHPIRDTNSEPQNGFQFVQGTIRDGRRCSSNKAFLNPLVRKRPNLQISLKSRVNRLLLEKDRAVGVEVLRDNKRYKIRARREVILSAGTFNSPQILMLSGIGPQDHLQELDIPVVKNLSVGLNLQDHVGMGGVTFLVNKSIASIGEDEINDLEAVEQWLAGKGGPLSVQGGVEALGFLSTRLNDKGPEWPDMEMVFQASVIDVEAEPGLGMAQDLAPQAYEALITPLRGQPSFTIIPYGLRPRSKGMIRLRSKDPNDAPMFIPNYFSERRDVEVAVEGTKMAIKIAESPLFKQLGARLNNASAPGCESMEFGSDEYWECHLKTYTMLFHHQVGTCKMGPSSDPDAVVDHRLRVHGIKGLRVMDTSIIPTLPGCHTGTVAIMIGEKGADLIKQDWSLF